MSAIPIPTPILDPAQAALAALSRAGLRAAEEARRANTYMVVEENGKVLHESPQEYLRKRQEQTTPSTTKNND
ncbi:UNVERIFIED_CONTAM: hypothetical protein C7454_11262 [Acidovorax defluvii]